MTAKDPPSRILHPNMILLRAHLGMAICLVTSGVCGCQADLVGPEYDYDDEQIEVPGARSGTATGGAAACGGSTSSAGTPSSAGGTPAAGGASPGGGAPASGAAGNAGGGGAPAPTGACDMSGRWLVTQRMGVEALGVRQAIRTWFYYEIAQSGEALTVSKGLHCGYDVIPLVALGANVDLRKSFPRLMTDNPHAGRKGTSKANGGGCGVTFEKLYSIDGATAAFYRDPAHPLPAPEQQATATSPGWEDYDGDGKPGSSYSITGLVTGVIHIAGRTGSDWAGTVPNVSKAFSLANAGSTEEALLGYEGSPLLASTFVKANDPSLQFAELARLGDDQAVGDDTAVCQAVRTLASTLTPNGNEKPL